MDFKYDAFLSYSSYDNTLCNSIQQVLISNNISVCDSVSSNFNNAGTFLNEAIYNSESFVFVGSSEFLRLFHKSIFCANIDDCYPSHVYQEIQTAIRVATSCGLRITVVLQTRKYGDENIRFLLDDIFGNDFTLYIGPNIESLKNKLLNDLAKHKKYKSLFAAAELLFVYGAYEKAYQNYIALLEVADPKIATSIYNRIAECCLQTGRMVEAQRFYQLSNNQPALEQLSVITSQSNKVQSANNYDLETERKIANYCDSAIDLFYHLLKDCRSVQGFNCLKTSYTRLLNYCKTVGGMDDVISSYLVKMEKLESDFKKNDDFDENVNPQLIKSYRTYLGLDFPESENYDVFISYKSEDELLAKRVYDFLLENGKRVFFSRETLAGLGKTEYREAIMDALDHSQHFILIASDIEFIFTKWVKEEWSFFVSKLIEEDHKGNIALIFLEAETIDKLRLPPNLRYKQRFSMSNYKTDLIQYLKQ
jgi:hypothetical protein